MAAAATPVALPSGAHPAEAAAARLVETGARPGRIGEGAAVVGGGAGAAKEAEAALGEVWRVARQGGGWLEVCVPSSGGGMKSAVPAQGLPFTRINPHHHSQQRFFSLFPAGAPPSPKQGERVRVERMGGPAAARGPGGIPAVRRLLACLVVAGQRIFSAWLLHASLVGRLHCSLIPSNPTLSPQVDVRPGFETAPVSAAEVAEMKAREHAIVVSGTCCCFSLARSCLAAEVQR